MKKHHKLSLQATKCEKQVSFAKLKLSSRIYFGMQRNFELQYKVSVHDH